MDQILTEAIARIGETSKRFKQSQERLLKTLELLSDAQQRLSVTQIETIKSQQELAVDVGKLLIAIQGNEAKFFNMLEIGNPDDLKQLYELCKEAQSIDYMERNYMVTIGKEIDDLTLKVIEQQQQEFNNKE